MKDSPASSDQRFSCPGCDEDVDVPPEVVGQLVRCPYCNTDFFASEEHLNAAVVDDTPPPPEFDHDSAINKLRIAQYAALRRGAIRSRSWCIITQWACTFVLLDSTGQIFIYLTTWHRWGIAPTLGLLTIPPSIALGIFARRRAKDFQHEIESSALTDPNDPPDFAPLNDGSDLLNRFDQIQ